MIRQGTRIAVIDDDESVRKALARLLSASCYDIRTYGSAREFIKSDMSELPGCLLLDLYMPEISGLDLQNQLRKAGITIPTIVITAHDEPGLRERCQSAGVAAFLTKPLNQDALISAINNAMETAKVRN
jgi:FixJ family two-component response regulator